jgi:uncharacterized protein (TIGR02217 family)
MGTQVFPSLPGIGWSVTRSPMFKTRKQVSISGKETSLADWSYPRYQWELCFNFLRQNPSATFTEMEELFAFYNTCGGGWDSFLYWDTNDNTATSQVIAEGDGSTVQFQLCRSFGGSVEPIFAPHVVSKVTVNGVTKTNGTDYGIGDWGNGVTPPGTVNFFTGAPPSGEEIAASFTFYWPCRFVEDQCAFEQFTAVHHAIKKLAFMSIK